MREEAARPEIQAEAPRKLKKWMCKGAKLNPPRCDYQADEKWTEECPGCGGYWDVVRSVPGDPRGGEKMVVKEDAAPVKRISTGMADLDRVIGGGLVPGQVLLFTGDPGGGKSTLVMQACDYIARGKKRVIYSSGEQNNDDIRMTAARLGISNENIALRGNKAEMYELVDEAKEIDPVVFVVDSINSAYMEDVEADINTARQMTAVGNWLTSFAKTEKVCVIIICQITKEGDLSGPKNLEHNVDTVVYLDGSEEEPIGPDDLDEDEQFSEELSQKEWVRMRLLRIGKNRFGPPGERAVLEMMNDGIKPPSKRRGKLTLV